MYRFLFFLGLGSHLNSTSKSRRHRLSVSVREVHNLHHRPAQNKVYIADLGYVHTVPARLGSRAVLFVFFSLSGRQRLTEVLPKVLGLLPRSLSLLQSRLGPEWLRQAHEVDFAVSARSNRAGTSRLFRKAAHYIVSAQQQHPRSSREAHSSHLPAVCFVFPFCSPPMKEE